MSDTYETPLAGSRVLLAEDEALIGLELTDALTAAGAQVFGPVASLDEACEIAETLPVDAAILDIDLRGDEVFPAAEILAAREIPFVFHTGKFDAASRARRFDGVPVYIKPVDQSRLIELLKRAGKAS